ncbi:putative oxidoreductase [compost metagenome]
MIKAVELSQRIFVVHQNRRWDEDFLAIQKINDENIIGDIFHLESRVHGSRGIPVTCVRKRSTVAA